MSSDNDKADGKSEKEDFSDWIICGSNGETFVGRPVLEVQRPRIAAGDRVVLSPCYRYETTKVPVPQADMHGRVTGVSVQVAEIIGSPANAPCDVETELLLSWVSKYPRQPGLIADEAVNCHIARIVKIARDNQIAARAASAGITRASGLRM